MLFSLNEIMDVNVENVQFDEFFQNIFAKKNNKSVWRIYPNDLPQ